MNYFFSVNTWANSWLRPGRITALQEKILAFLDAIGFGVLPVSSVTNDAVQLGKPGEANPEIMRCFAALCAPGNKFPGAVSLGIRDRFGILTLDLKTTDYRRSIDPGTAAPIGNRNPAWTAAYEAAQKFHDYFATGGIDWPKVNMEARPLIEQVAEEGKSALHWLVIAGALYVGLELLGVIKQYGKR